MGYASGIISDDAPGILTVTFSAEWSYRTSTDWGAPGDTLHLYLRAYVGSGPSRLTAILGAGATTATLTLAYPGGGLAVPVGLEYAHHAFDGPSTVSAARQRIAWRLEKDTGG